MIYHHFCQLASQTVLQINVVDHKLQSLEEKIRDLERLNSAAYTEEDEMLRRTIDKSLDGVRIIC